MKKRKSIRVIVCRVGEELNWVRLALIPAGGDWRDLPGVVPDGLQRREVHRRHMVADWERPVDTVAGSGSNGVQNIADPRVQLALGRTAAGASTFKGRPGLFGVSRWDRPAPTVTATAKVSGSNAPAAVADPRIVPAKPGKHENKYRVRAWDQPALTVIGATRPGSGAQAIADPRLTCSPRRGAYGVLRWDQAASTIGASLEIDNGRAAVADPRIPSNPRRAPDFTPIIVAADGTWHRPLTTLELAALQGFPTELRGGPFVLDGDSSTAWRERIGNAIPPPSAQAIASEMLLALLASRIQTYRMSGEPIWVEPIEIVQ
jgi:site-specific DNA-cytosine methylase